MKLDLDVTQHGKSEIEISAVLRLSWADDRPDEASLEGSLQVQNLDSRVVVKGNLLAKGKAGCGRCLEDFDLAWEVPVEIVVLCDVETDDGDEDIMVIRQTSGVVDLTEALRESLVLAFPAVTICSEECRGLCAQCGTDLNKEACRCAEEDVDPRWAGLDALDTLDE